MKTLIVCGTPYQTFNALNLVFSSKESSFDICIFDRFNMVHDYAEKIRSFLNIEICIVINDYNKDIVKGVKIKGIIKNLHSAYLYLRPKSSLRGFFSGKADWKMFSTKNRYDRILAPTPSFFLQCIEKINPNAKLDYYEDGLGSYTGNFNEESASLERKLFSKIFKVGYNVLPVRTLYVYNPEICRSTVANSIKPLPVISERFLIETAPLFNKTKDITEPKAVIWLTQITLTEIDKLSLQMLLDSNLKVTVRMHPKDRNFDYYKQLCLNIDDGMTLWEYMVGEIDIESIVLISASSTAMLTPKLLYDKEPIIIFTYKLYGIMEGVITDVDIMKIDFAIQQIRDIYRNKERIFVPETADELKEIIKRLK